MGHSRRQFLKVSATGGALVCLRATHAAQLPVPAPPWYTRTLRWGQTNLTEIDPKHIDIDWWRAHWKRTRVQGVVINAGGIVAYYPTKVPYHRRARELGVRDLLGELTRAAHDDGLAVFARMDSNRADEALFRAHPDWFAQDAAGKPYLVTDLYVACVNSPYYREYLPAILREIVTNYRPEGVTDNNWNGPMRHQPCFCAHCEKSFRARTGAALPRVVNWDDPLYREWISWNYARRLQIWDEFNRVTRKAGGRHCIWVGMMAGSQSWQSRVFRDDREIYRRTELIMLDHQRRFDAEGFQNNAETGMRLRSVGGWDKVIPESMAMYHLGEHNFRLAAKPEPEARLWVVEGFAGGVQPWWHHLGATQEDRRMFATAEPLWRWHEAHEAALIKRKPIATVGLVWSQRNMDFFGRDDAGALVEDPWNGFSQALVRARIPYVPVHIDDIERVGAELDLRVLILPNLAAVSDAQVEALGAFVGRGGNLLATGLATLCDEHGQVRRDLALGELFGVRLPANHAWRDPARRSELAKAWSQTYLRLPADAGTRHETLSGFVGTDLIAFGGLLEPLEVEVPARSVLTFVPPVPLSPPEDVWMRDRGTTVPALVLNTLPSGSRIAYLPADIDRRFARDNLPDHGQLLAALTRWCAQEIPLEVEGPGLIDCRLYGQELRGTLAKRLVLHLVNLNNAAAWRTPAHEILPIGPVLVRVRAELRDVAWKPRVRRLVGTGELPARFDGQWCEVEVPRITDHEVLVIE